MLRALSIMRSVCNWGARGCSVLAGYGSVIIKAGGGLIITVSIFYCVSLCLYTTAMLCQHTASSLTSAMPNPSSVNHPLLDVYLSPKNIKLEPQAINYRDRLSRIREKREIRPLNRASRAWLPRVIPIPEPVHTRIYVYSWYNGPRNYRDWPRDSKI